MTNPTDDVYSPPKHARQLSGNRIETVNGLTFKHLAELRVLQLRNSRISVLQPGAFHGMNSIEKL